LRLATSVTDARQDLQHSLIPLLRDIQLHQRRRPPHRDPIVTASETHDRRPGNRHECQAGTGTKVSTIYRRLTSVV